MRAIPNHCMQVQEIYIETQVEQLRLLLESGSFPQARKQELISKLLLLQPNRVSALCAASTKPLSGTNIRYLLCFLINMEPKEVAMLFSVEVASVYSVRYRLRKMFPASMLLPF